MVNGLGVSEFEYLLELVISMKWGCGKNVWIFWNSDFGGSVVVGNIKVMNMSMEEVTEVRQKLIKVTESWEVKVLDESSNGCGCPKNGARTRGGRGGGVVGTAMAP